MSAIQCNTWYQKVACTEQRQRPVVADHALVMRNKEEWLRLPPTCLCSLPIPGALQLDSRILLLLEQQHALEDAINLDLQHAVALVDLPLHLPTHPHDLLQRSAVSVDHDAVCVAIYDLHGTLLPARPLVVSLIL